MYTLMRSLSLREFLLSQAPTLLVALAIAEMFYKFHSFLLEAGAFLATWYVLDAALHAVTGLWRRSSQDDGDAQDS